MSEQAETDRLGCALWEAQETEDRRYRSILDLERFLLRIKIEQSYIANPYFKSSIPKHMKELQRFYMEVEIIKDVIRGTQWITLESRNGTWIPAAEECISKMVKRYDRLRQKCRDTDWKNRASIEDKMFYCRSMIWNMKNSIKIAYEITEEEKKQR